MRKTHLYQHMRNVVAVATIAVIIDMQRDRLVALAARLSRCRP